MANDQAGPFGPFEPSPAPVGTEPEKKKRGRKAGTPNKPRADSRPQAAANGATPVLKVDLALAIQAAVMLKPDDADVFTQIASALSGLRPDARQRILTTLGRVFD